MSSRSNGWLLRGLAVALVGFTALVAGAQWSQEVVEFEQEVTDRWTVDNGLPERGARKLARINGRTWAETEHGWQLYSADVSRWARVEGSESELEAAVRRARVDLEAIGEITTIPAGDRTPFGGSFGAVLDAAVDQDGSLWIVSADALGRYVSSTREWTFWDDRNGLPVQELTSIATTKNGVVWIGSREGLVRFDGRAWSYRQGRRWLPGDEVRDLLVDERGAVWVATNGGVARISGRPMTLVAKAAVFEEGIDRFHRRTPYEYVASIRLETPGETKSFVQRDTDNDGLWTGMYGSAECFAYAATGSPEARRKARKAFEALKFLSEVTQGGTHPTDPGFIARTILPTSGPDPNEGRLEQDRQRKVERDSSWKVIDPRWPTSADGQWYWKTDASSDELDGHFFFYAAYYDLVAESEEEKQEVREVVLRIVDHLLDHNYALVDHDGLPTRWAVFGPDELNRNHLWWGERGLNSMSILSYLRVALHVSGDERYDQAARDLIETHHYDANVQVPKMHSGPGTGNQSDDEMAFMGFYNLIRYEPDPELKKLWSFAFYRYWRNEVPERNPLFHFLYAATYDEDTIYRDAFDTLTLEPEGDWLEDSVDTLRRYPLDRVDWGLRNSHRRDLQVLRDDETRGTRRDGKVLPIDERFVEHWNHDPWQLDYEGEGRRMADGASFLLPYYMGLYYGFLVEK